MIGAEVKQLFGMVALRLSDRIEVGGLTCITVFVADRALPVGLDLDLLADAGGNVGALSGLVRPGKPKPVVERQEFRLLEENNTVFLFRHFQLARISAFGRVTREPSAGAPAHMPTVAVASYSLNSSCFASGSKRAVKRKASSAGTLTF